MSLFVINKIFIVEDPKKFLLFFPAYITLFP